MFSKIFILILILNSFLLARSPDYHDRYYGESDYYSGYTLKKSKYFNNSAELNIENNIYSSQFKYGKADSTLFDTEELFGSNKEESKIAFLPKLTIATKRHQYDFFLEKHSSSYAFKPDEPVSFANRVFTKDSDLKVDLSFLKIGFAYRYYLNSYIQVGFNISSVKYDLSLKNEKANLKEYVSLTQLYPTAGLDLRLPLFRRVLDFLIKTEYNTSGSQTVDMKFKLTTRISRSFYILGCKSSLMGLDGSDLEIDTKYKGCYLGYGKLF
jgi:hypothetical protein